MTGPHQTQKAPGLTRGFLYPGRASGYSHHHHGGGVELSEDVVEEVDGGLAAAGVEEIALGELADIVQLLGIQRLVKAKAFHCLCVHLGVDAPLAHHDFDGVARDHANQRKREQRYAEKRGDQ